MASSSAGKLARVAAVSLMALVVLPGLGCRQPTDEPPPPEPTVNARAGTDAPAAEEEESSAPGDAATSDGPISSEADLNAVLAALTQAVRRYGVEQRRVPTSLEELVAKGYLSQVPEAPRGKRFRINKQLQVYLANE